MIFDRERTGHMDQYITEHTERFMGELARLVAVPTVAAQHRGVEEGARLTAALLETYGYTAEILSVEGGNPVVVAGARAGAGASRKARPGGGRAPVLLFYNHYDVQPAEPVELWDSDPFTLTRRGDRWFGRGVSDDKGHIISRLLALEAVKSAWGGELPLDVKFVIEGEEEVGSLHMPAFVHAHRERLAADACIWEFGGVDHNGRPQEVLGLRGICYVELSVKTADHDAHSGLGGSIFPNAAWRLVWALASLKGPDERIRIPHHADHVRSPDSRDLELLAAMPEEADDLRTRYGVTSFLKGMTGGVELRREQVMVPTCTICGLSSGYEGPGSKTVLPAVARAKVDFRLVPDQTPEEVLANLRAHLDAGGFADVEITQLGGDRPARTDPDHHFIRLALDAARDAYGLEPVVGPMSGGSGPAHPFTDELGLPVTMCGIGYPGGSVHAPNEHIVLQHFVDGTRHAARIVDAFALAS